MEENNKGMLRQMTMKNRTIENLWDEPRAVLGGKFIAVQAFLKKQENFK